MNRKNKKMQKIKLAALVPLTAVLLLGILELTNVTHLLHKQAAKTASSASSPAETINYDPPTDEDKSQVEDSKTDEEKIKESQNQNTPTPAADKNVVISNATQQASKDVVVQTQLSGIGWGTCTLTLSLNEKKVTETAETLYQPDFSSCLGFSVPYSKLNEAGTWKVQLSVTNSDGKIHTATPVEVKVSP